MSVLLFGGYRRILAEGVAIRMPGLHPIGGRATPFTSWGYSPCRKKEVGIVRKKIPGLRKILRPWIGWNTPMMLLMDRTCCPSHIRRYNRKSGCPSGS